MLHRTKNVYFYPKVCSFNAFGHTNDLKVRPLKVNDSWGGCAVGSSCTDVAVSGESKRKL
jgi:hypothetical protein